MIRSFASLVAAVALLGASPAPAPAALPAGDRVAELVGTWTCRNPAGVVSTVVYRAENGRIAATETSSAGSIATDLFRPDPSGGWHVDRTTKYGTLTGYGPAWTSGPWVIDENQKHGTQIRYERIDDHTMRRTFSISGRAPYSGEICVQGGAPPDLALCAVPDMPALVLRAAMPDIPLAAQASGISGIVDVLVSLDATGRVVDATIEKSDHPALNAASVAAARNSTYQPALHDCKPVASTYSFRVEFNAQRQRA